MPVLEPIEYLIVELRGHRVMFDFDLAAPYGVQVMRLNEAVRRNADRFPADFMFQLTAGEWANLKSQIAISSEPKNAGRGRPKARKWGGRRTPPLAFTQEGVAMLSGVLNSPKAIEVNAEIMRAFVRMRTDALSYGELSRRIDQLEAKYDDSFSMVFEALRALMEEPEQEENGRKIGFRVREGRRRYGASLK